MAERRNTEIEKKLDELMGLHNSVEVIKAIGDELKHMSLLLQHSLHSEIVAHAFAQHAAAMVAAMKIAKAIRPELADALAKDFYETVVARARPGTPALELPAMSEPPKGLRVRVENFTVGHGQSDNMLGMISESGYTSDEQAKANATYINWLIETDEKRREHIAKQRAGSQDLLVDLGDMTRADLDQVALDLDYESMTEDFLQTFNNVVIQGIPPIKAIFSMSQAFAIALGYCLRANLPWPVAQALLTQIMKSASASEKMVRIVTKQ